jgi:hypothetical protein
MYLFNIFFVTIPLTILVFKLKKSPALLCDLKQFDEAKQIIKEIADFNQVEIEEFCFKDEVTKENPIASK